MHYYYRYFKNMKIVYAKPILLTIAYYAIHFALTISLIIEAIQVCNGHNGYVYHKHKTWQVMDFF